MTCQPQLWLTAPLTTFKIYSASCTSHYRSSDRCTLRLQSSSGKSTILTGIFVALLSSLLPLRILADLVNIGTLLAFVIVCAAVLIMRRTHPDARRPFRAPLVPLTPILGILTCVLLMFSLPAENCLRLGIWLLIGFVIFFGYSRRHSVMARYLSHEITKHGVSPA